LIPLEAVAPKALYVGTGLIVIGCVLLVRAGSLAARAVMKERELRIERRNLPAVIKTLRLSKGARRAPYLVGGALAVCAGVVYFWWGVKMNG
jgi:hypothetical protein